MFTPRFFECMFIAFLTFFVFIAIHIKEYDNCYFRIFAIDSQTIACFICNITAIYAFFVRKVSTTNSNGTVSVEL